MSINHTTLATKLGKLFGGIKELNTYRGTTLVTRVATLRTAFGSDTLEVLTGLTASKESAQQTMSSWANDLSALVTDTIIADVNADRLLPSQDIDSAFTEWVRQLTNDAESFNDCPVSFSMSAGPGSAPNPTADYTFVYDAVDTDGKVSDFGIPDRYLIQVIADADNGGTRWAETLSLVSKSDTTGAVLDAAYPTGTATNATINVIDPATNGGLVADSGFDSYTAGDFDSWTRLPSLTAADVFQGADDARDGASGSSLDLVSDGVNVPGVKQTVAVTPNTVYVLHFAVKGLDDTDATGTLHVTLRNADTDAIIANDQAVNLSKTSATAATLVGTGLWTRYTATWATPSRLPEGGVYLDIRLAAGATPGTAPTADTELRVDHVYLGEAAPLYDRGVRFVAFSGATEPARTDQWELTVTLTAGAVSDYIVRWMDRTIGLASRVAKLPTTTGTPTQLDALIA